MANLYGRDATGADAYLRSTGTGTNVDPFVVAHDVFCSVHKSAFVTASGNADLVALVADKKIRVTSFLLTASDACTLKFQSGGGSDLTPPFHIPPSGNIPLSNELGLFETATGQKLNVVLSGTATYTAFVTYREV
jgi:hypothetical protein